MSEDTGNRRGFFRQIARKTSATTVEGLDAWARQRAKHWIRPPFALDELDFLLACTRCRECIDACPAGVVFALPARLGAQFADTPALDLLNKACLLCADWPCVKACAPGALRLPESPPRRKKRPPKISPPRLATVRIHTGTCLPYLGPECGACRDSCPIDGALVWEMERPHIDPAQCTGCAQCRLACIAEPKAIVVASVSESARHD